MYKQDNCSFLQLCHDKFNEPFKLQQNSTKKYTHYESSWAYQIPWIFTSIKAFDPKSILDGRMLSNTPITSPMLDLILVTLKVIFPVEDETFLMFSFSSSSSSPLLNAMQSYYAISMK